MPECKQKESVSHEIDHVKVFSGGTIALEIEWNNKDPFYDRDLENFKRLHPESAISIGALITRGKVLQDALEDYLDPFSKVIPVCGPRAAGGTFPSLAGASVAHPPLGLLPLVCGTR